MDRTWLLLTGAAASIAVICVLLVVAVLVCLALRGRALVRGLRQTVDKIAEEAKATSKTLQKEINELEKRGIRLREKLAASSARIREGWRAYATRTNRRREN